MIPGWFAAPRMPTGRANKKAPGSLVPGASMETGERIADL
jgi:hypothetical protein